MTNNIFLQQTRKKKKLKQIVTGNVTDKKGGGGGGGGGGLKISQNRLYMLTLSKSEAGILNSLKLPWDLQGSGLRH